MNLEKSIRVAPFAGAWIEIFMPISFRTALAVAPFAGAWIEMNPIRFASQCMLVAPFAGAWIEILCDIAPPACPILVAPFAGAWIEIDQLKAMNDLEKGRSLRGSVD